MLSSATDAAVNITSVSDGTNTTSYVYDSANQLVRENNQAANKTWTYEYDSAGNLTAWKEYAYTTGSLGAVTANHGYSYGDSNWGDLMRVWNGNTITSDAIGNMLSDGTRTYTWRQGREMVTVTMDGVTWTNSYDAGGIRTRRTDGTTAYSYVYNGSRLSQLRIGDITLNFAYDASGTPMAMDYNGESYYYVTNIQGDVVAILNGEGAAVVTYTYDAWGNILSTSGSLASTLGVHNPLRYRGYVYDQETGLYYLQSRYYNPEMGRFISADAFVSTGQGLLGNNMFAYCLNNPVTGIDSSGTRTYIINGINNDEEEDSPFYAICFAEVLTEFGIADVRTIPVYNNQVGLNGTSKGIGMVLLEMFNIDVYTAKIVATIQKDLEKNPLAEGEQLNLIGYSGGGQLALNVMEALDGQISNVVLIGTPIMESWNSSTRVSLIYAGLDPLSWNVGFGYTAYFAGWIGHTDYFNSTNIQKVAQIVNRIID